MCVSWHALTEQSARCDLDAIVVPFWNAINFQQTIDILNALQNLSVSFYYQEERSFSLANLRESAVCLVSFFSRNTIQKSFSPNIMPIPFHFTSFCFHFRFLFCYLLQLENQWIFFCFMVLLFAVLPLSIFRFVCDSKSNFKDQNERTAYVD